MPGREMMEPRHSRRWYEFDPMRTILLAMVVAIVLVTLVVADLRRRIDALPEPGRATPQYVLDAADEPDDVFEAPDHFRMTERPETIR